MKKSRLLYLCVFLLMPLSCSAQSIDTTAELRKLINVFKTYRNMGYDYNMDVAFPNGEKDHLEGYIYIDNDAKRYYNQCDAFVMLYTSHWFYKADHRKKIITVLNLDNVYNKKLKKATEKDIFQNNAAISFLDSVVLKKAIIKKMTQEGEMLTINLGFPKGELVQKIDLVYNQTSSLLVSYQMVVHHPWRKTPKGLQVIESSIKCSKFRTAADKTPYEESDFFSYNQGKLEVSKYKSYKLYDKM